MLFSLCCCFLYLHFYASLDHLYRNFGLDKSCGTSTNMCLFFINEFITLQVMILEISYLKKSLEICNFLFLFLKHISFFLYYYYYYFGRAQKRSTMVPSSKKKYRKSKLYGQPLNYYKLHINKKLFEIKTQIF